VYVYSVCIYIVSPSDSEFLWDTLQLSTCVVVIKEIAMMTSPLSYFILAIISMMMYNDADKNDDDDTYIFPFTTTATYLPTTTPPTTNNH